MPVTLKPVHHLAPLPTLLYRRGIGFGTKKRVNKPTPPREVTQTPEVTQHENIYVVRDDRLPGGTKSRFLWRLFQEYDEVIYPSPSCGGAQIALAQCAKLMGKKVTLFIPKQTYLHPRILDVLRIAGARPSDFRERKNGYKVLNTQHVKLIQVPMGFQNVLVANANRYSEQHPDALNLTVGANSEESLKQISHYAKQVEEKYGPFDEVWCAAGSGVLTRGLQRGFTHPNTKFYVVRLGMEADFGKAVVFRHPKSLLTPMSQREVDAVYNKDSGKLPACTHYDLKAWQVCLEKRLGKKARGKKILFWNVMGPPSEESITRHKQLRNRK